MKITIDNEKVTIVDPTSLVIEIVSSALSYTDKSKEYQIRRMMRNPWLRNSPELKQLQKESSGKLYELESNVLSFPSALFYLIEKEIQNTSIQDLRKETGRTIALPWIKKPHDLREYQEEAVNSMMCHAKGQKVLLFNGAAKKVEDIVEGDILMGPDSLPRQVLKCHSGNGPLYKISPNKGETFVVNENHLLSLRRSYSSLKRCKKRINRKNLVIDDEIITISVKDYVNSKQTLKHKYKLYKTKTIHWSHAKNLNLDPYILGLWLGDGASNGPEFSSIDKEIIDSFKEFSNKLGLVINQKDSISFRVSSKTKKANANLFLNELKRLRVLNSKHIPNDYVFSSEEDRLQLLAGLIDTDGSYYEGIFEIVQKNKQIADSIVFIARSLGLAAYLKQSYKRAANSKHHEKSLYYRITITGDIDRIPTKVLRKKAPKRKQIKNVLNLGFKVEEINFGEYYGFEVDKDHLYLMDNFIVTHNCNSRGLLNLATGLGKTLTAVHLVKRYKKNALIVCPSESVAKQFYEQLVNAFGQNKVGFYGGGKKKIKDITVGIAASICKNTEEFKKEDLGLIIVDEVHHLAANTFYSITSDLANVGKIIGLTATDYRSDGKDILINAGCGPVLLRRDVKWGVENGWLAEPYFIVREIDTGGRDIKDDKLKSYKEHVLNNQIMKDAIRSDAERMMASGKSVLILVDEVAHGEELSKQLSIPFATGEDKMSQSYVDALNNNKIKGLVGTDGKISEGTDTKNVDVLIMANFVASKGAVMQCIGRALRKQGDKTKALILDYKPLGSTMLSRHCNSRISYYKEITSKIKIIR